MAFYNQIGGETDYLSLGLREYPNSAERQEQTIKRIETSKGHCMFLMFDANEIIGIDTIDSSPKSRYRHVGILGIVISQSHTGKGFGRVLMNVLTDCARGNGQTKNFHSSLVQRREMSLPFMRNQDFIKKAFFVKIA